MLKVETKGARKHLPLYKIQLGAHKCCSVRKAGRSDFLFFIFSSQNRAFLLDVHVYKGNQKPAIVLNRFAHR